LLGLLLFVSKPSRAITTRGQRRRNLGGKLLLLLFYRLLRLDVLFLSFALTPLPSLLHEYSSSGRCALSVGCDFFLGMVAAVVVEVELLLLKLLMILFLLLLLLLLMLLLGPVVALLAWAQAPSPRLLLPAAPRGGRSASTTRFLSACLF